PFGEVLDKLHRLSARLDFRPDDIFGRGEEQDFVEVEKERGIGAAGIEAEESAVRGGTAGDRDEILSRPSRGSREGDADGEDPCGTAAAPERETGRDTSDDHFASLNADLLATDARGGMCWEERRWPRASRTETGANGGFSVRAATVDYLDARRS